MCIRCALDDGIERENVALHMSVPLLNGAKKAEKQVWHASETPRHLGATRRGSGPTGTQSGKSCKSYAWGLHMHDGTTLQPFWSRTLSFLHYILTDLSVEQKMELLGFGSSDAPEQISDVDRRWRKVVLRRILPWQPTSVCGDVWRQCKMSQACNKKELRFH